MTCSKCHAELSPGKKFCTKCGTPVSEGASTQESELRCAACGATIAAGKKFCTSCGTPVAQASVPAPEPVPFIPIREPEAEEPSNQAAPSDPFEEAGTAAFAEPEVPVIPDDPADELPVLEDYDEQTISIESPAPAAEVKYCKGCGAELAPGAEFCLNCGKTAPSNFGEKAAGIASLGLASLKKGLDAGKKAAKDASGKLSEKIAEKSSKADTGPDTSDTPPTGSTANRKQEKKGGLSAILSGEGGKQKLLYAVAGVAVIILIIILLLSSAKPLRLDKYVKADFSGYNGYGYGSMWVDYEYLLDDYKGKIKLTKSGKQSAKYYNTKEDFVEDLFYQCIYCYSDPQTGLSNGDTCTCCWSVDTDILKSLIKNKVKYEEFTASVDGLVTADTFDVFAGVEAYFDGTAPYGEAYLKVDWSDNRVYDLDFEAEPYYGLSNGDIITVTAYYRGKTGTEALAEYVPNYGVIPSSWTKTFTVNGLNGYIATSDELSDNFMTELIRDGYNRVSGSYSSVKNSSFMGYVFLSPKEPATAWEHNRICLIYEVTANYGKKLSAPYTFYTTVEYRNILSNDNGECNADLSDYSMYGPSFKVKTRYKMSENESYTLYGYQSIAEAIADRCTSYADEYNLFTDFPSVAPDHYATNISEISDSLNTIADYLTPMIREIIEEKYVVTDSISLDHAYLLSSKNDAHDNRLIVVLKTDAHADAGYAINSSSKIKQDVTFKFYSYIEIPNVIVRQDGSYVVNYANNDCCLNKLYVSFPCTDTTRKPYYYGYATLEEVYNTAVSPRLSSYNVSEYQ